MGDTTDTEAYGQEMQVRAERALEVDDARHLASSAIAAHKDAIREREVFWRELRIAESERERLKEALETIERIGDHEALMIARIALAPWKSGMFGKRSTFKMGPSAQEEA